MIARGFKPVAWVAAVGTAALGCYMLSLRVAAERAELTGLERKIVTTEKAIRSLQTELETRGRVTQLQQWNDDILALAPPSAGQFLDSQVTLARFSVQPTPALADQAEVRMASAEAPAPAPVAAAPLRRTVATPRPPRPAAGEAVVQRASLNVPASEPAPVRARPSATVALPARARTAATLPPRARASAAETPPRARTAAAAQPPRTRLAAAEPPRRPVATPPRTRATSETRPAAAARTGKRKGARD